MADGIIPYVLWKSRPSMLIASWRPFYCREFETNHSQPHHTGLPFDTILPTNIQGSNTKAFNFLQRTHVPEAERSSSHVIFLFATSFTIPSSTDKVCYLQPSTTHGINSYFKCAGLCLLSRHCALHHAHKRPQRKLVNPKCCQTLALNLQTLNLIWIALPTLLSTSI